MRVYNCARDHKMRLMQLFPLGLHSHGMRATRHLFARKVLQGCCIKKCAGRFLLDNRRCCTTLAKVRCLQTQTCEELEQSKVALPVGDSLAGRFAGPASGRKGWSPGLCCSMGGEAALTRKMMFSFYRCHHVVVCSLTTIQEARGKRSSHLLVSLSAIAQEKTKAIKTQFRNCI